MGNQQVTEFELGWLIGIFDGEGCYSIAKANNTSKYEPSIKFVNTNMLIIQSVHELLTKLDLGHRIYDSWRASNQKAAKRIEINGLLRVKKFLDILFPRMYCRAEQAQVLKMFVDLRLSKAQKESYGSDEFSLYCILRKLNQQGPETSETVRNQSYT